MISLNSNILITGGTGMIGSSLIIELKKKGYLNILAPSKIELNLFNLDNVKNFLNKNQPEIIILASGKTGGIKENISKPSELILENIMMQNNILSSLKEIENLKRLFFLASSCVYPAGINEPMREEVLLTNIPEETSIAYSMAKLSGIYSCKAINVNLKSNICVSLIPASCYGPNDNFDPLSSHVLSGIMSKMIYAKKNNINEITLWGSGRAQREFIYVDDLSKAILHLMDVKVLPEVINIGFGEDISIKELAKKIAITLNYNGKILWNKDKVDGALKKLLNSDKVFKLNWKPKVKLAEGLALTYDWIKKKGDL